MTSELLYLDHAATTPVRPEVLQAMWPYLTGEFGNPSSHHPVGERAAHALADARERVAAILGVRRGDIIFTSGGTESNNVALRGIILGAGGGGDILFPGTEHDAIRQTAAALHRWHDTRLGILETDSTGRVDAAALGCALSAIDARPDRARLVTAAYANNEFGTVQDLAELTRIAHDHGAYLHTDAVQAAGSLRLNFGELGVDSASFSGHKLGAPKGIGVLYLRGRIPREPLIYGGGQERGVRSGTENIAGAVGFARGLELAEAERSALETRMIVLRDRLIERFLTRVPGARLTGHPNERLPQHASFVIDGVSGEAVLLELQRSGMIGSSGSACAAGSQDPSPALLALGLTAAEALGAIRFTFGSDMTEADVDRLIGDSETAVRTVLGLGSLREAP